LFFREPDMGGQPATLPQTKAWLVLRSGPLAGTRYPLRYGATTRAGRAPDNDVVIQGPHAAIVSLYHLEVALEDAGCRIRDMGSTNGTFVNGERVAEAELPPEAVIRVGNDGPEYTFVIEQVAPSEMDRTLVIPDGVALVPPQPDAPAETHEVLLSDAVMRARQARARGSGDLTMTLMRDVLRSVLRKSRRRHGAVIWTLVAALVGISSFSFWKITELKQAKRGIDTHIAELEAQLQEAKGPEQADRLLSELDSYQNRAESLEKSVFYRLGVRENESFITKEIRRLMSEFGAEVYSIPPDFTVRVNHYIEQYQGPDRPLMQRALNEAASRVNTMRKILEQEQLPPDFAYVPLVESALSSRKESSAGAAGPWQFTPATARAYGLRVDGSVDERLQLVKSTHAGCRYLRDLILDFGAGSSVMLALAAYNLGPPRVKQAIIRNVKDPIKQRNFWYLYRARALPPETREYVPKVFAAILIGRNPEKFGFE
jgi:membrane-bound lytic murein transglycosylase D